ncbi:MAG: hypothetical protein ABF379_06270 [Akkermansiaceae bacterium]
MKTVFLLSALIMISCNSDEKETSNEEQPPAKPETTQSDKEAKTPELVTYSGTPEGKVPSTEIDRKPSTPSSSMAKVIAANSNSPTAVPRPTPQPRVPSTPQEEPTPPEYKTAKRVPDRAGYVFNPWTNQEVDVRGIPEGSLVRDPNDSNKDHKFRISE